MLSSHLRIYNRAVREEKKKKTLTVAGTIQMFSSYQIHVIYPQSTIKKLCPTQAYALDVASFFFLFFYSSFFLSRIKQSNEKIALRSESMFLFSPYEVKM